MDFCLCACGLVARPVWWEAFSHVGTSILTRSQNSLLRRPAEAVPFWAGAGVWGNLYRSHVEPQVLSHSPPLCPELKTSDGDGPLRSGSAACKTPLQPLQTDHPLEKFTGWQSMSWACRHLQTFGKRFRVGWYLYPLSRVAQSKRYLLSSTT